jgi:hypothetical protein
LDAASNKIVEASGVIEEFAIATALGKYPIPIGATGHAARSIWEKVTGSLDKYFPSGGVKGHFKTLGRESSTNDELVDAVIGILGHIKAI